MDKVVKLASPIAESSFEVSAYASSTTMDGESAEYAVQVSSRSHADESTAVELLALVRKRADITAEERAMFAKEIGELPDSLFTECSWSSSEVHSGALTEQGVDACVSEKDYGWELTWSPFNGRAAIAQKDNKPDYAIRVMCRLLTDGEVEKLLSTSKEGVEKRVPIVGEQ
jgi:hypothetical protein